MQLLYSDDQKCDIGGVINRGRIKRRSGPPGETIMMSNSVRRVLLASSGGAAIAALLATSAYAEAEAAAPKTAEIEEIVVTGEKANKFGTDVVQAGGFRGAKTLDTPQTVAVVPLAVLQSQQAVDLLDALRNTAGVSSSANGPAVYNNVSIRGIAVDTRANFKLDGTLNIISSVAFPLEDKDRVEVLKGASALYYGFSNPSGIVNLTMKRPTRELLLTGTAFGDNHGGGGGAVDFGDTWGPFGARINLVDAHLDNGVKFSGGERYLLSGAFDFRPTDKLTVTLNAEHFGKKIIEPGTFRFSKAPSPTVANPYPALTLPPLLDPSSNFGPSWAVNNANEDNVLAKVAYKFTPAWDLTLYAGESRLHRVRFLPTLNPTNLVTGAGTLTVSPQNSHFKTVNYGVESAGEFYVGPFENEVLIGAARVVKDSISPTAAKVNFNQNFLNPIDIPDPHIDPPAQGLGPIARIEDGGVYLFDRIKYHGWLQVLGGLRKSDYTESDQVTHAVTFHATPLSYSYGVVLKPRSWASVYATYIQGLETTPAGPTTAANANQQLPPTTSTQKEVGVKIEPFTGLLGQIAYFDIRRGSAFVNSNNFYVLDGDAEYKGLEVSLAGDITHELSLYASAVFLSAKQVSGAPTIQTATTFSPTAVGKRIEATPNVTASLAGEYDLSRFIEGLKLSAGVYHVGNQAVNALNQAFIPAYTTFDLGASYAHDFDGHRLTFRINGQNVGNKKYWASTGGLFLGESLPATVKFSVTAAY
jgi:iron complex outermembrane receptor protein